MIYVLIVVGLVCSSFLFSGFLNVLNYRHKDKAIPDLVSDIYDEKKYLKWKAYYMENFRFSLFNQIISFLMTMLLLLTGFFPFLDSISKNLSSDRYIQLWIFIALFMTIGFIIDKFMAYYKVFTIEEKYGFNKRTKKLFYSDSIKEYLLRVFFIGLSAVGFFALYNNAGVMFYVYGWIGLVLIIILINILYVPLLVPIFNKLKPLEEGKLKDDIESFAKSVGYTVSKISVMDASRRSSKINAFFSGFGKFKHIVLFDTLIEKLTTEEVVAVLAHEIGHSKKKHVLINLFTTIIQFGIYLFFLLVLLSNLGFSTAFGFSELNFGFILILFIEFIKVYGLIVSPFLSGLSRKAEYQADHYAATKYKKEPMISALKVLSRENFSNLTPHPFYVKMTYSHPPTYDRIKAIKKII